jgi:hypothetical protein
MARVVMLRSASGFVECAELAKPPIVGPNRRLKSCKLGTILPCVESSWSHGAQGEPVGAARAGKKFGKVAACSLPDGDGKSGSFVSRDGIVGWLMFKSN